MPRPPLLIRALHLLPPETAHDLALQALRRGLVPAHEPPTSSRLATAFCGLSLPHPLGLAAGFDKNAVALEGLFRLGFAFVEVGTVTPRPQAGNPKPRLFRLRRQQALINRMGFNNDGLEAVAARLSARDPGWGVVGANIGTNRDSPDPVQDYVTCLRRLHDLVDYVAVNVSSPNTPGVRDLQQRDRLRRLLSVLAETRAGLRGRPRPILLKIAPDLAAEDEVDAVRAVQEFGIDGLIVANTTITRPDIVPQRFRQEAGGLSGPPLFLRSTEQLRRLFQLTEGRLPLIGVGGISSGLDAYIKIRAGASALQLYTALIYQGPRVVAHILADLDRHLAEDGYGRLADAVGADARL